MNNPVQPLSPAETAQQEAEANSESPLHEDLVAIDMAAGKAIGGMNDITMSSDLAIMATQDTGIRKEIGILGSEALDKIEPNHGAKATQADLFRAEAAVEVLKSQIEAEQKNG
jgi:hypothetical protein